jgi:hypothetical protein
MQYLYPNFARYLFWIGLIFCAFAQVQAQGGSSAKVVKTRIDNCDYQIISGLAEVTKVEMRLPKDSSILLYDEYAISFKFIPKEGGELMASLRDQEMEFYLHAKGEKILVGPQYIKQYQIRAGTKYAMKFLQSPLCEEKYRFGDVGGLPNDISEAAGRIDEIKKRRLEEALIKAEGERNPEDTSAALTVPEAMSKEDKKRYDDSIALDKKRVSDSIAEYKRNFAFYEQERARAKADSMYLADSIKQAQIDASNPTITPTVIVPTKKDTTAKIVENPVDTTTTNTTKPLDIDKDEIRRAAEERVRLQLEAERLAKEKADAKILEKIQEQRTKDSLAQDKIRQKDYKKFVKDSIKMAKVEEARLRDSTEQANERNKRQAEIEAQAQAAEKARVEKEIEEQVRRELLAKQAEEDRLRAEEAERKAEEAKQEAERQRIAAEKAAAEKKRLDDEAKRADCVFLPKVAGTIHIVDVKKAKEANESYVGYAEYEIRFKFTPSNIDDIPKKDRKVWEAEYNLVIDPKGKSANPSAAYVTTYNVFKNARFNGFAEVLSSGNCNTVTVFSPQLPVDAGKLDLK